MTETDNLLTPAGSGATFGPPRPEVVSPSPLAKEIAQEIEERIVAKANRRPSRKQKTLLAAAAALAAGGVAAVVWVARRRS